MRNKEITPVQFEKSYDLSDRKAPSFLYEDFHKISEESDSETTREFSVDHNIGFFSAFFAPGIHVWEGKIEITHSSSVLVKTLRPAVQMLFCLKGNISYSFDGTTNKLDKSHHNLLYMPAGEISIEWQPAESTHLVIISMSESFFNRLLPVNQHKFTALRQLMETGTIGWLSKKNLNVYQQSIFILQNFLGSKPATTNKRLFVEAKVIELVGYQLDQYEEMQEKGRAYTLKATEIEKMYMVRTIILSNLSKHYSLIELAHQVGTNECYLKDHFKKVFGTTVYGYTQKVKMEKAKELILVGGKKISEIAKTTGFKYTSHFTSSFKKYFGVLPNKIKLLFIVGMQEFECLSVFLCECGV